MAIAIKIGVLLLNYMLVYGLWLEYIFYRFDIYNFLLDQEKNKLNLRRSSF
jgi:hypothetical protein